MAFDNRLCKFVFKWFIFAFKIFCYFDKVNECYFTMIYEDCDMHRQSSFCFYKINPSSGNLKRINNGYKPNSQGYGKSKMAAWLFPAPWTTLLLFDRMKPFLGVGLIISQWKKKWLKYIFCNLQWSEHPLCWTGHTTLAKISWASWRLSLSLMSFVVRQGPQNKGTGYMRLNRLLNMNTIFMTFCLTHYWLLIFVFRYKNLFSSSRWWFKTI